MELICFYGFLLVLIGSFLIFIITPKGKRWIDSLDKDSPRTITVKELAEQMEEYRRKWLVEFFSIPQEFRCNPFDTSESGDIFFADKRNVEKLKTTLQQAGEGKIPSITPELRKEWFGE